MWNVFFGGAMVLGGLCGTHVLRGTNSSAALVVVGGLVLLMGISQASERSA
jgi:hypothetical protein